ncbi:MAG: right-handed parallel beta-helix repeat-containing protein [Desulfurococcaceae archaeon]
MRRVVLPLLLLVIVSRGTASGGEAAIRILPDGTVEPPSAPIKRVGDVYTLLEDVSVTGDGVLVMRSGAVLDGDWRVLQGNGSGRGVIVRAPNVTVKNLVVRGFQYGVYASDAPGCSVRSVVVEGGRVGIGLWRSPGCTVVDNSVRWSMVGLYVEESSNSTVVGNAFEGCGLYVRRSYGNRVENNTVNGRPLVYLEAASGVQVGGAVGQVILLRCANATVSVSAARSTVGVLISECRSVEVVDCDLSGNVVGIDVWGSSGVAISSCRVAEGEVGVRVLNSSGVVLMGSELSGSSFCVYVDSSREAVVANSTVKECSQAAVTLKRSTGSLVGNMVAASARGIVLQGSEGVDVEGNAIWRNGAGVVINETRGCTFTRNEFVENAAHVVLQDAGPNTWQGNFWSDLWERGVTQGPYALGPGNVDESPATAPSRVLPVRVITPVGYATGSGWYERGSTARIGVWPSNLLVIRFRQWVDQRGRVVAHNPVAEVVVDEPLVLSAAWSLDPMPVLIVVCTILALAVLKLRSRKLGGASERKAAQAFER